MYGKLVTVTLLTGLLLAPAGCGRKATHERLNFLKTGFSTSAPKAKRRASVVSRGTFAPAMRWDHKDGAKQWTRASMQALEEHGKALPAMVPRDIANYCPGYPRASHEERKAFWVGLLSALSKHESTWNSKAVGGGGQWFGLVQISPQTAKGYGCRAKSGKALKNGSANLSCAIRIMAHTVPRDGVVSEGWRGVAADWGPFHQRHKREDMMAWTRAQSYCQ